MTRDKKSDPFAGVPRRLYRVSEVAHYLGMSKSKVRQLAWSGKLPFVQDGENTLMLFDVRDLDRWIDSNREAGK
ncbi:MAG TPA: helix-turn-helix domain-containing protein [Terriglobales bacterium]|jgi:excisionase family DNA binding protein|nr:helix-turn-helix domain-containing protein [Terriglobales bacterium]